MKIIGTHENITATMNAVRKAEVIQLVIVDRDYHSQHITVDKNVIAGMVRGAFEMQCELTVSNSIHYLAFSMLLPSNA